MDIYDPEIISFIQSLELSSNAPVSVAYTMRGTGTMQVVVTYSYMTREGEIAQRRYELDEPVPAQTRSEQRRDRVIVLLRKALLGSRSDGKVQR